MSALFDLYRPDPRGSVMWLGTVQSYDLALFGIELTAASGTTPSLTGRPASELT